MSNDQLRVLSEWVKKNADDIFTAIEEGNVVILSSSNAENQTAVYKKDGLYKSRQAFPLTGRGTTIDLSEHQLVEFIYSQVSSVSKSGVAIYPDLDPETIL
ncbi:hypothetical protein PAECIP111891_02200 [Paenibacillus allorhizoplanae]|uniref:Uncharacterized protein n=1 Tax=Paenibacillus allorhizoplanae TaxID=2905648 RepID=A0ABM9C5B6_9BACL|nr:hypothetical protein [Paenibacillus allorhizoplanae]CAH1203011.1 hypothetical protein PAECIP111891_02200 [Paenibacillus allorhizoplanae]